MQAYSTVVLHVPVILIQYYPIRDFALAPRQALQPLPSSTTHGNQSAGKQAAPRHVFHHFHRVQQQKTINHHSSTTSFRLSLVLLGRSRRTHLCGVKSFSWSDERARHRGGRPPRHLFRSVWWCFFLSTVTTLQGYHLFY